MKFHYAGLDGLRGVAALIVVVHHLRPISEGWSHGYLAVDFFFALSGFVIAAAYEDRFAAGMGLAHFARLRIIRLWPMIVAGAILGGLARDASLSVALRHALLVPAMTYGSLFPLNAAYWSLLSELGANFAHAALFRWTSTKVLALGVFAAAPLLAFAAWRFGDLGGGHSSANWWAAGPRVVFSYALGLLVHRLHKSGALPRLNAPFPLLALTLASAVTAASIADTWWVDALTVLVVWPVVLVAGITTQAGRLSPIVAALGAASYPLYAIHVPVIEIWETYLGRGLIAQAVVVVLLIRPEGRSPLRRSRGGWQLHHRHCPRRDRDVGVFEAEPRRMLQRRCWPAV